MPPTSITAQLVAQIPNTVNRAFSILAKVTMLWSFAAAAGLAEGKAGLTLGQLC